MGMSLLDWFKSRGSPAPPKLNVREYGPAADDPVEHADAHEAQFASDIDEIEGVALALEYADAMGEISSRRIIAMQVVRSVGASFVYVATAGASCGTTGDNSEVTNLGT